MAKKVIQLKKANQPVNNLKFKIGNFFMSGKILHYIKAKLTKKRLIFLIVLIAIAAGIIFAISRKKVNVIDTTTVQKGTVAEELILSGKVKAEKYVQMAFPVSGKVSWVGVSEGDEVKKGQALSSIDSTTLDAAYQQAQNMVRKYGATVDYVHDTLKNKSSSETYSERDTRTTAEAMNDYYYNALRTAEYNLKNATLYAPFNGLVTSIGQTSPGVDILFTDTQIELVDPKTIYFEVSADQNEVIDLKMDQEVKIVLDPFSDEDLQGKVIFISYTPQSGESGVIYKVKVMFEDLGANQDKFRVGMTGDAKFILSQKTNTLYVPSKFVHSDKKGKYVDLNKKGNKVYIEVGLEGEDRTEIKGSIKEGDILYD